MGIGTGIRCAAVVASAVGYGLLFAPFGAVASSWICLVPLFLALRGATARAAAALAALWSFVATAFIVAWLVPTLHGHFGFSRAASVAFWAGVGAAALAPWYAIAFGAAATPLRRAPPIARVALFAATWVAAELARTHLGLASPWTKLGDAHAGSARLRQIAALGGVFSVSFVVAFANAAVAEVVAVMWRGRGEPRGARLAPALAPLAAACALVAASLAYGALRAPPARDATFPVAIVQGNVPAELNWSRASAARVVKRYAGLTRDALHDPRDAVAPDAASPALIVWPENAIQTPIDDATYGLVVRRLASRVPILLGAPRSELRGGVRRHFNSALLVRPDGAVEAYDKRRLLPFSETKPLGALAGLGARGDLDAEVYTPGDRAGLFDVAGQRVAVLICMEALYPALAREAARGGATVIANLSNDGWYQGSGGAAQHLAQVVFRAVETGLPVVRATTTGISAVVAPDGAVVAQLDEGARGVLAVAVPLGGAPTLYARTGDLFALACAAAWVLAAAQSCVSSRAARP